MPFLINFETRNKYIYNHIFAEAMESNQIDQLTLRFQRPFLIAAAQAGQFFHYIYRLSVIAMCVKKTAID